VESRRRAARTLSTERLELRPWKADDGDELHALFADPGVRLWLLDDQVMPREWVDDEIAASTARFAEGTCGLWALREEPSGAIVGFAGFRPFWEPPELELLYGLHPSRWGRGYATEAARAALDYAFGSLELPEVRAATDVPNTASIAVLTRLGFHEWKRTDHGPQGTIRFELSVGRWREGLTTRP